MDNLRSVIEILFKEQDPAVLLKHRYKICKNYIVDNCSFIEYYQASHRHFSGDQVEQLYLLLQNIWTEENQVSKSVFNTLLLFGKQVLRIKNEQPVCQYEHYLRWSEMTAEIGEDILTCSFLAQNDIINRTERCSFAWNSILESDNIHLEALFNRGLSELHCHLNGSSLNFDLNWLAIMNEPDYQKEEWFAEISSSYSPSQLYLYAILASFIRMYLFLSLEGGKEGSDFMKKFKEIWESEALLSKLPMYTKVLQKEISGNLYLYTDSFDDIWVDYATSFNLSASDKAAVVEKLLVGERRLLYKCFERIFQNKYDIPYLRILLHLYLVIKIKVRSFFIQNNKVKGFANFKKFDKNKDVFIKHSINTGFQKLIPKLAIDSYKNNKHIRYCEFRIAPKSTASKMRNKLNKLSAFFKEDESLNCIFHFIKIADRKRCFDGKIENCYCCRNYEGRQKYAKESRTLELLLSSTENRIVGIDAANSEFGCRPEVFAEIYRRLQHLKRNNGIAYLSNMEWKDLGITFHVGEDFYDVVDGLRAIEEAILFLNMKNGARLGHAVALGIDAFTYYMERKNTIIIPKQDLLDNYVWLLAKMDEYAIPDLGGIRSVMMYDVQRLMSEIYPNFSMKDYRIYYQSWLLRGDEPSLYRTVDKNFPICLSMLKNPYMLNHIDKRIDLAREQICVRRLYHDYHYDAGVKHRGYKPEEVRISEEMIRVIELLQEHMRNDVAKRKIAIEVNPTSNLRICNLNTYDTHPIVKFRNYGLPVMDKYNHCPQISVSINTDDKGIFATSLEREYTLMALALEKQKTVEGRPKYQFNDILSWLENIREEAEVVRFRK